MDPSFNNVLATLGSIFGAQSGPNRNPKSDPKWNQFWNRLLRISEVGTLPKPTFLRGDRTGAGWLEIYPAKEREG